MSGQWVKPKKISDGRPTKFFSVTVWPLWSVSWNGPPMAAGAATLRNPPNAHSITSRPTTRLALKAPTMTSGRVVRSILNSFKIPSEAGGDAGHDGLEKSRRPVVEPEHQRGEQRDNPKPRAAHHDRLRDPARREGGGDLLRL